MANGVERVATGGIELTWDAATRLAVMSFAEPTRATGPQAALLVKAMQRWVGTDGEPFALIGDGSGLTGVDAEYRSVWATFFRKHRDESWIAFFRMGPVIRVAAEMFRIGTGIRLKAFASEEDARAWLRKAGIPA